jgi:hypothetical protein
MGHRRPYDAVVGPRGAVYHAELDILHAEKHQHGTMAPVRNVMARNNAGQHRL